MADKSTEKATENTAEIPQNDKSDAPVEQTVTTSSSKAPTHSGEESPRTAREPDFDDDALETPHLAPERQPTPSQKKRVSFQDDAAPAPPPKPPRPTDPQAQAEVTLVEAFPSMDAKVVKAVLMASGGKLEPAFNALLSMSDPDFQEQAPPPPPRKAATMSQVESDALYARQLAEHYNSSYDGFGSRSRGDPPLSRRREAGLKANELHDKEHSFIDDDLPVIKDNLQKGFQETKNTINKWIKDFQRKLDGEENDEPIPRPGGQQPVRRDFGPSQSNQLHGIRKSAEASRRSGEPDRYDADPQVLSDDFGHRLELRDDQAPPTKPPRPLANPNLFKPGDSGQETGVMPSGNRSSSLVNRQPSPATGAKSGKWQPLTSVEPKAELEDHDPFSLGDSDEDADTKKDAKTVPEKETTAKKPAEASTNPAAAGSTAEASTATSATKLAADSKPSV